MEKNDNKEDKLLKLIREFTKDQKEETIQKRLENYSYDNLEKKSFSQVLLIIINKNEIEKKKFLYQDTLCEVFINILESKKYSLNSLLQSLLNVNNEEFRKIMIIAMIIDYKSKINQLHVLFKILNPKDFMTINQILEKFGINKFNNFAQLIFSIQKIYIKELEKEAIKENPDEINLSKLLKVDNDFSVEYVNNEDNQNIKTEKNNQKNIKNISEDEEINRMKNEEEIKLQNERIERIERIKALINNSIKIRCDATLENN